MKRSQSWLLSILAGCGPRHLLTDVPISGASPAEEAALAVELEELYWAGLNDISLSSISVEAGKIGGLAEGTYDSRLRAIRIHRNEHLGDLRFILRHEVCHAVDYQRGRPSRGVAVLSRANEVLSLDAVLPDRTRTQEKEGFANLCALGPGPIRALQDPAHDDVGVADAATWFREQGVFVEPTPPTVERWMTWRADPPQAVMIMPEKMAMTFDQGVPSCLDMDGETVACNEVDPQDFLIPSANYADFLEVGRFHGSVQSMATADSGAMALIIRPVTSKQAHFFGRVDGGMWATLGVVDNAWLFEAEGIVYAASAVGDEMRIDRVF